ncbi:EAL domain-containing protein [Rhizobium sp. L245/93]|uniref:putative bifunctional diguanylate cyclase/phosphodiesterase n=2 Tax=Rhizobium TaxID=379 RepID=UPI001ADA5412|nr:EAL domain-containing protein [Rhizobium sp. L245/93]MBO9171848.1 EAL domain-containing protein [Rhizobium sp. L245/93]
MALKSQNAGVSGRILVPDIPGGPMNKKLVVISLVLTVLSVFCLSVLWEYGFEKIISEAIGVSYHEQFEDEERWRFIWTTTLFAALAVLAPTGLLLWLESRLSLSYEQLNQARWHAEDLARTDSLTGLPNRRAFSEELAKLSHRKAFEFSVLIVDLDDFKPINDLYGHATGDAVLIALSEKLRALLLPGISISRIGGDEFGVILDPSQSLSNSDELATTFLETMKQPLLTNNRQFNLTATIGISSSPADGKDAEAILHAADTAMYFGKRTGSGRAHRFNQSMDDDIRGSAALVQDLREAIADGDIRPHYQPLMSLHTGLVTGFEVLARWYRKDGTITPPESFISVVEKTGLMEAMTFSILRQTCVDAKRWPLHLKMAVNISPLQFADPELPEKLTTLLDTANFAAERIEIEITESALISDMDAALANVSSLKKLGMKIALDDFGTGYSSLGHLREIQFDKIKIDRSFATTMLSSPKNASIVASIIELCHSLGLETVVEGVETIDLMDRLTLIGCEYGQGYFFSRPLPADGVQAYLEISQVHLKRNEVHAVF